MVVSLPAISRLASVLLVIFAFVIGSLGIGIDSVAAQEPSKSDLEVFFESKVRPLLIDRCVECHGADDQSGLLRLDRKPALDRSVGSGPVVAPGQPDASLLIRAIRYDDSATQMPPDGKLSEEEIAVLEKWVSEGAFWPEETGVTDDSEGVGSPSERIDDIRQSHWAYRPITSTEPPAVQDTAWPQQPIDNFILSELERQGLTPSPQADRRMLINRLHFVLTGLPPTFQEVSAFEADDSPDALANLVDRLLDSQHYGERWARHWLDLARFAETVGYLPGSVDTTYPYAYTYRDYVIDAFNDDKPFDQFILEQIAADQLDLSGDDKEALAGLGFLTVGRRFMNRVHDIIDDRIDVVTRGFLATSVSCARCHDHKYDPIPIADYYSLYGVFASSHEPGELPLIGDPEASPLYEEFLAARAEKQKEVDEWLEQKRLATEDELRSRIADYLVHLVQISPQWKTGEVQEKGPRGVLRPPAIRRWQSYLDSFTQSPHPIWSLWHRLINLPSEEFESSVLSVLEDHSSAAQPLDWDRRLVQRLTEHPPKSMTDAAQVIGGYLEEVYTRSKQLAEVQVSPTEISKNDSPAPVLVSTDEESANGKSSGAESSGAEESPAQK
jgi:hypothetical protein